MLNENIKAIRKSKGLSQQELAIKLNVVRQTVSKWEQGLSVPDSDMLISLSEALETPVSTLLGETVVEDLRKTRGDKLATFAKEKHKEEIHPLVICRVMYSHRSDFCNLIPSKKPLLGMG